MSQQPVAVVGDGNIAGNNLNNVGNRTIHQNIFTGPQKDKALAMLELKVAFDALLNSEARYPAPKCHIDTRKAARPVVTDWICGRGEWAEKGIMWISGAPGVGKSAIVQTVCETLDADDGSKTWLTKLASRSNRKVDGCHFFGKGLGDREKASFFPATIAFQLYRSSSTCRDLIKNVFKAQPGILAETFSSQFRQLLTATVKKRWSFRRSITIVIDALDECDNLDDQVELLGLMLEAVTTKKIRFLIASRPEHQIHAFFQREDASQHTYHVRLDEETFNTSRDIEVFLRAEFARIRREKPHLCLPLPNGEDWPGNKIIIQIRDDSDSQFMFPRLCINYIDTPSFSPHQRLRTLVEKRDVHAFFPLDGLYHLILSHRSPDLADDKAFDQHCADVKEILLIMIAWPGDPLSASQIAWMLGKEVDVVQNIVRGPMRSLFKFASDDPDSPISFCHKSLRDHLLDQQRSHEFFIDHGSTETLLTRIIDVSRQPHSDPSESGRRALLFDIMALLVRLEDVISTCRIASLLDVTESLVEEVIFVGPSKLLFKVDSSKSDNIAFSIPSLRGCMLDAPGVYKRSLPFAPLHAIYYTSLTRQSITRQPVSDSSHYHSYQDTHHTSKPTTRAPKPAPNKSPKTDWSESQILKGVLKVLVVWRNWLSVPVIASVIGVDPAVVVKVVSGRASWLFFVAPNDHDKDVTDISLFFIVDTFLHDAERAGEFYIRPDANYDELRARIHRRVLGVR